jgi:hypothetical protein
MNRRASEFTVTVYKIGWDTKEQRITSANLFQTTHLQSNLRLQSRRRTFKYTPTGLTVESGVSPGNFD